MTAIPRNASGTYTLPQAAFVPQTTISSAAMNSNLSDIATALTQSLATTGVSSMTGALLAASGSVGSPSYTYASDTATGFYLAGSHQIGVATNGATVLTFNSDQSITFLHSIDFAGPGITIESSNFITVNATSWGWGSGAANGFWQGLAPKMEFSVVFDGGGSVIQNGTIIYLNVPFTVGLNNWVVIADQSGSITFDILRANNSVPSASIIGGGNAPTLSSSQYNNQGVSGWTSTTLNPADIIGFKVNGSPSSVTRVTVNLIGFRTSNV